MPKVVQTVKNLPAMQETGVWFLDQADLLEKGMVTHSSILAWRIPWTEEPCRLQSIGLHWVGHNWTTFTIIFLQNSIEYRESQYWWAEWMKLERKRRGQLRTSSPAQARHQVTLLRTWRKDTYVLGWVRRVQTLCTEEAGFSFSAGISGWTMTAWLCKQPEARVRV